MLTVMPDFFSSIFSLLVPCTESQQFCALLEMDQNGHDRGYKVSMCPKENEAACK